MNSLFLLHRGGRNLVCIPRNGGSVGGHRMFLSNHVVLWVLSGWAAQLQAVKIEPCRRPSLNWQGAPSQPYESAAARYADAPIRRQACQPCTGQLGGLGRFRQAMRPPLPANWAEGGMTDVTAEVAPWDLGRREGAAVHHYPKEERATIHPSPCTTTHSVCCICCGTVCPGQ